MNWELFAAFLVITLILVLTPGPIVTLVIATGATQGIRAALVTVAGTTIGNAFLIAGIAFGLSWVLKFSAELFEILRWAGAAYLIWLGIQMWRAPDEPEDLSGTAPAVRRASLAATFRGGFLVGISNPKLLIFAAAFFPQFITRSAPWLPQFALLVATFVMVELLFYVAYALSGRRLADRLMRGPWRRWFNRVSGAIFAGFGCVLLRYRP